MKSSYSLSGLLAGLLTTVAAQAADSAPTLDQVLDKYVKALGGKEAALKLTSRSIKGTVEAPQMGGAAPWDLVAKAPNKQLSSVDVPGFGAVREGCDGKVAWSSNPAQGSRVKTGAEMTKALRDSQFHRDLDLKKVYPNLVLKGPGKVGEEEAQILESKPGDGSVERFFFSSKTGLLVRAESELEAAQGKVSLTLMPENYRAVDGVQFPFTLRLKAAGAGQPEMEFTIKITEVKHNLEIDDAKFAKP